MANIKRIHTVWDVGKTLYAIVEREVDDYLLDSSDGTFKATPTSEFNSLTADGTQTKFYKLDESRAAWDKGQYNVNIYEQAGGSPVIANDKLIHTGVLRILDWGGLIGNVSLDRGEYLGHYAVEGMWSNETRTVTALDNIITGMVIDQTLALEATDTTVNVVRADTPTLTITLGQNTSAYTTKLYVKTNINDADGAALVDRAMTDVDTALGIVSITLTAAELATVGNKYAEVNLDDGAGVVLTAAQFRLNIIERVKD